MCFLCKFSKLLLFIVTVVLYKVVTFYTDFKQIYECLGFWFEMSVYFTLSYIWDNNKL